MEELVEKRLELIENKLNRLEAVLMAHISAVDILLDGSGRETAVALDAQATAAVRRGDKLASALLSGAADEITYLCDLPRDG